MYREVLGDRGLRLSVVRVWVCGSSPRRLDGARLAAPLQRRRCAQAAGRERSDPRPSRRRPSGLDVHTDMIIALPLFLSCHPTILS